MICGKCSCVNRDGAKSCIYCGSLLEPRRGKLEIPLIKADTTNKKSSGRKVSARSNGTKAELQLRERPARQATRPARQATRPARPSITIDTRRKQKARGRSAALVAIVFTLGALVIAGIAILVILIITDNGVRAAASQPTAVTAPVPTRTVTSAVTETPTATPEPTEDISSVFSRPSDALTGD